MSDVFTPEELAAVREFWAATVPVPAPVDAAVQAAAVRDLAAMGWAFEEVQA